VPPRAQPISLEERRLRSQVLFETFRSQLLRLHFPAQDLVQALEDPLFDIWSHGDNILVRALRNLLPFGRHLTRSDLDHFVDHTLEQISRTAIEQLFYWQLAGTTNSLNEPLDHVFLTENETQFWNQYVPQNLPSIQGLLYEDQHVYYLTKFDLDHGRINIEFSEIRISTRPEPGRTTQSFPLATNPPRLVITDGREYSYRWDTRVWTNSLRNPDQRILNPITYHLPPLAPQSLAFAQRNITPPLAATIDPAILDPEALENALNDLPQISLPREETLPPSSPPETTTSAWSYPAEPYYEHCWCNKEICTCGYRPNTPPTPPEIRLWKPYDDTLPSAFAT